MAGAGHYSSRFVAHDQRLGSDREEFAPVIQTQDRDWFMQHFDPITARLVLALARDGSIAKTADRENIAPSAVSRRIADLEARMGIVLFDRSATGVSLTAAGTQYAEGCRRIFREISSLHTMMGGFASGDAGQLRIAASTSSLSGRLPELLALYAHQFPLVTLDIREMSGRATITALEDAQVDLAIFADNYRSEERRVGKQSETGWRDER